MSLRLEGDVDGIQVEVAESTPTDGIRIISRGRGNRISIGKDCRISGHFFLADGATLEIGDSVKSTGPLAMHLHEGSVVRIGDNCLFSQSIVFRPSDAHKIFDLDSEERLNPPLPIIIGKGVWMGEQVLVLKGS